MPVRLSFSFISKKPKKRTESNPNKKNQKKTEPNRKKPSQNQKKPSQIGKTEPNRFEPVFVLKNRIEPKPVGLNRFRFGFGFFSKYKIFGLVTFFYIKTEPNRIENDHTPTLQLYTTF
jgi:hypothetical protein